MNLNLTIESDSKSGEGDFVPVRFRPSVPNIGFRVVQRNQWLRGYLLFSRPFFIVLKKATKV